MSAVKYLSAQKKPKQNQHTQPPSQFRRACSRLGIFHKEQSYGDAISVQNKEVLSTRATFSKRAFGTSVLSLTDFRQRCTCSRDGTVTNRGRGSSGTWTEVHQCSEQSAPSAEPARLERDHQGQRQLLSPQPPTGMAGSDPARVTTDRL